MTPEFLGLIVAFALSVMVLSYLIGDNPLYRIALHVFVGAAAGYITIVVLQSVLGPRLFMIANWQKAITSAQINEYLPLVSLIIPAILAVMLLFKLSPRASLLGNLPLALMVGVGAAVAVAGAVTGTIFPQVSASWRADPNLINALIINLCTVLALLYFFYSRRPQAEGSARPSAWGQVFGVFPRAVITITLAALYAGALAASLAVFSDRIRFILDFLLPQS